MTRLPGTITGDQIACEGGGVRREGGKGKPAETVLEQCERQGETTHEGEDRCQGASTTPPLGSGAPGAVGKGAIRGAQCVSAGPGKERKEVAGQRSSPERHRSTEVPAPATGR